MSMARADRVFPFFVGAWIVLAIVGLLVFVRPGDAERKRRLFRPFTIGVGALFIFFVVLMGIPSSALLVFVPGVAAITLLNVRNTQFCPLRTPRADARLCATTVLPPMRPRAHAIPAPKQALTARPTPHVEGRVANVATSRGGPTWLEGDGHRGMPDASITDLTRRDHANAGMSDWLLASRQANLGSRGLVEWCGDVPVVSLAVPQTVLPLSVVLVGRLSQDFCSGTLGVLVVDIHVNDMKNNAA
jgi:hypothetical protein